MISNAVCRCLLALTAAGIAACGNDHPPAGPDLTLAATIAVSPDSVRLMINDTARVRAAVLNVEGDTLPDAPVSFLSSDTTVATIDASGLVRARAGGVSDIEVRSDTITTMLRVRVHVNGTLRVSPRVTFLQEADSVQLSVVVKDSTGTVLPSEPVQYRSLDTSVARVSPSGLVKFGGAAGSVLIQVSSVGRTDGAMITAVVRRIPSDGAWLVTARGNTAFAQGPGGIQRVDLTSGVVTDETPLHDTGSRYDDLVVNPQLTRAYLARGNGSIVVVDLVTDTEQTYGVGTVYSPRKLAVPAGDSVVYFAADSQIYRLTLATFMTAPVFVCGWTNSMIVRDSMLYTICYSSDNQPEVREYNMRTRTAGRSLKLSGSAFDLAIAPSGARLYVLSDHRVEVRDLVTGDSLASVPFMSVYGIDHMVVQPGRDLVWLVSSFGVRVYVLDIAARRVTRTLQTGGYPVGIVFGAAGTGVIINNIQYPPPYWFDFVR